MRVVNEMIKTKYRFALHSTFCCDHQKT